MATLNLNEKKIPSAENLRLIAQLCISLANKQSSLEDRCIAPWKSGEVYQKDISYVSHGGYIYLCSVSNNDTDFVESHWTKLSDTISELTKADMEALVNLTPEQITNLQSLIDDTSISTTHTNSSSHIYMAIQDAIAECKDDTLKQIAKKVSGSYKIANTTADIVSADYIYLLSNGTNYDLYVLVDGTATKVGDTNIDLSEYVKITDLADYMKTSDADGKFATITTVDGKFDKTNILTALDNSATDDKVYSAKAINAELDGVVKKTDISTTINSTSTDDTVPTNKAVETRISKREIIKNVDLNTFVDEGKYYIASGCTNSPIDGGYLNIMRYDDDFVCQICARYYISTSKNMYIRTKVSGTWQEWQSVCTTSVADVPVTIVNLTGTDIHGTVKYMVKSGICYVSAWGVESDTAKTAYRLVEAGVMPKPIISSGTALVHGDTAQKGKIMGQLYIDNFGALSLHIYIPNTELTGMGYGSFSYPVAES